MGAGQFAMGQAPTTNMEQVNKMEVCVCGDFTTIEEVSVVLCVTQKMIQDLELAKKETWEEKERLSAMYEDERTKNLASKVSTFKHACKVLAKLLIILLYPLTVKLHMQIYLFVCYELISCVHVQCKEFSQ